MRRFLLPLVGLLGLVLVTGGAVAAISSHLKQGPVYSVAAVRAQLEHDPQAWVGRTVVVRAIAEPCPWWGATARLQQCAGRTLVLIGTPAAPLPLVRPAPHPLLPFVRGLPILGGLLPRPRMVPLFVPTRFRVRLLALPCYEALWLDAAPGSPWGRQG